MPHKCIKLILPNETGLHGFSISYMHEEPAIMTFQILIDDSDDSDSPTDTKVPVASNVTRDVTKKEVSSPKTRKRGVDGSPSPVAVKRTRGSARTT
ncbi:hypothetical protein BKA82DRAFT_4345615 [Pisolithus tinctorius]|nr:hypothetical protein BKA82DRAFT_4356662 [Pisolithus tinctorius]KAI6156578.1 hypothetical protein BKA82DRAFT_4345615 [Pisolithus tinctorius]